MSVSPGRYDFTLQRRADFLVELEFQLQSDPTVAVSLAGKTVLAQAWDKARTTKYADFTIAYIDRAAGKVSIALTDAQTATFPNEVNYDVMVEDAQGLRDYFLEGVIYVSEGYTA